jgi:hypothetical protein
MKMRRSVASLLGCLLILAAGCAPLSGWGQPQTGGTTVVSKNQEVGQTFTSWHDGLLAVDLFLKPADLKTGFLQIALSASPVDSRDIVTSQISLDRISTPGFYRFTFPPQDRSSRHDYYLKCRVVGEAHLELGTAPGDSYLEGSLYQNDQPRDAQLAFRLAYDPVLLIRGLSYEAVRWLGVMGIVLLLYILPGWSLISCFGSRLELRSWAEKLGIAAGISLAFYPVGMLWTNLLGIYLGSGLVWISLTGSLAALIYGNRAWRPAPWAAPWRSWRRSEAFGPDIALVIILVLVFGVRFYAIRPLEVPLWGDSLQHTMIARLIADHGGLFNSWEPYAEMKTFTYHFGFHANVAVFHWLTGWTMERATLWLGQIVNGLAVLSLYSLAFRFTGNRWAGVGSVLLAGLLFPLPMGYVNWGRYTQLCGQTILPAVVLLSWVGLKNREKIWPVLFLSWLTLGGLALTHYRVLIFFLFFLISFYILETEKNKSWPTLKRILWIGAGAGIIFLPWFIHIFSGKILAILSYQATTSVRQLSDWTKGYNAIGDVRDYLPVKGWLLLALGLGFGLWRREKGIALMGLWWFWLLLAANPQWLGLPGAGSLSSFAVMIAVYIPAGIIIGIWAGSIFKPGFGEKGFVWTFSAVMVCIGLGLWGGEKRLNDLDRIKHSLATRSDLRAFSWINHHLPKEARFLVNSAFAYGDTAIVGVDGGWWLPLLTDRKTMLPPLLYVSETGPRPDYVFWVNALPRLIAKQGLRSPEVISQIKQRGITHIYIGQKSGRDSLDGISSLSENSLLRLLYHQDRVWIFEIKI